MKKWLIIVVGIIFLSLILINLDDIKDILKTENLKHEVEESGVKSKDEKISSNDNVKTTPSDVMLKAIEVIEDEISLKLIITSFEDEITQFMKDFEIEYYEDYNELRFSNYNKGLYEELLVNDDDISDITGSKFIKDWYETHSTIDHSSVYGILFKNHIKYTVEELVNPGRLIVTIQKSIDTSQESYILRSPTLALQDVWPHMYLTADLDEEFFVFRIIKDGNGYFYPIKTFKSEKEAESYKNELIKAYEEIKTETSMYKDGQDYNLIIEKRN